MVMIALLLCCGFVASIFVQAQIALETDMLLRPHIKVKQP
jgi:hypothetical protein